MVWRCAYGLDIILALIFVTFSTSWIFHFLTSDSMKVYRHWVPMSATLHTSLYQSFWNFAHVFSMVWRCAYGLDIILELFFVTFSTFWTFAIFWPQSVWKCIDIGVPYKRNSLYNFILIFMQLCTSFFHGLKMCIWFGFNPAVNFCHFSTLLTFLVFNFRQVRHQLHQSLINISFSISHTSVIQREICVKNF